MIDAAIVTSAGPDGFPVTRVTFDLSHVQLDAVREASCGARTTRHRDQAMGVDDVIAMRRLTALCDEVGALAATRLASGWTITVGDLALLHDVLSEWLEAVEERGWMRDAERDAYRLLSPLTLDLGDLRARAMRAALEAPLTLHEPD